MGIDDGSCQMYQKQLPVDTHRVQKPVHDILCKAWMMGAVLTCSFWYIQAATGRKKR
jgi:hypothetical protein